MGCARNQSRCASFRAVRKRLLEQRWPWLVAAGFLVLVFLSTFVEIRIPNDWDRRPEGSVEDIARLRARGDLNVLFIVIDTLRAERMGSYGYGRDTSPVLDRLAHSGVRFARHLAQSTWTKSSMASLWTGLYPARTGITRFDDVVPPEASMTAELLRDAGFETIALWRNGWVAPTFGFDQGFEVYQRPAPTPATPKVKRENPTLSDKSTDHGLIEAAQEFLRVSSGEPWFLYIHLMDLHEYIYGEETALFGNSYPDLYDNSIRWTDGSIGFLLESLSEVGQLDRTLIIVTSDHGEAFLERGFEGHARRVYRETTDIPLLISFPFRLEPGIVVDTRTQNVDVMPTLLDLLGLEIPGGLDGRSRLPEMLGRADGLDPSEVEFAISDLDRNWSRRGSEPSPTIAVLDGPLRYVRVLEDGQPPTEKLFDATDDPLEMRNLAGERPETVERLRAAADQYYETEPSWGEAPTREISELELNLLRALGYKLE
jgi:arylsulfatase A-like enzyme